MFLDEPTSGLDPVAAHEVHGLIGALRTTASPSSSPPTAWTRPNGCVTGIAIMNTHLRIIGRPDELRQELFSRSLAVTTAASLDRPDQVFAGLPAVQGCTPPTSP